MNSFLGIRLDEDLKAAVRERAAREGRDLSDVARDVLRDAMMPADRRPVELVTTPH